MHLELFNVPVAVAEPIGSALLSGRDRDMSAGELGTHAWYEDGGDHVEIEYHFA
jgi:hypothetical protein